MVSDKGNALRLLMLIIIKDAVHCSGSLVRNVISWFLLIGVCICSFWAHYAL